MRTPLFAAPTTLQVRTLQLEMEYAYGALEDETRDIVGDSKGGDLKLALSRRGSSDEVALLVAGEPGCSEQAFTRRASAGRACTALEVARSTAGAMAGA